MLTFFRRIRKGLLEGGRTSKYLLYAIGEILLVMIGILLALQVNNWKENKIARKAEKVMLIEIEESLQADITDLNFNIDVITKMTTGLEIIENHIEVKSSYHDSLAQHFGRLSTLVGFYPNSTIFESLKSAGMELISSDSLRTEIINYYTFHHTQILLMEKEYLNAIYHNMFLPFINSNFSFHLFGEAVPVSYQKLVNDSKTMNTINAAQIIYNLQKSRTQNTRNAAQKLRNHIIQKLKMFPN